MAWAPRAWAQASNERHAELYMARVLSETLLSRERRSRARSAVVRPVADAGRLSLGWFAGAGMSGFCRAISGNLNISYKGHYRPWCPGFRKGVFLPVARGSVLVSGAVCRSDGGVHRVQGCPVLLP